MLLARVVGRVWCTVKNPEMKGQRLLVVQPLSASGEPSGRRLITTDCTGAGAGETVYCCRGKESSFPFLPREVPTDLTVVGIVDSIDLPKPEPPC
jgi:ethanolamine utilization protein EutN